jgi:methylthioribose-1-phosphate isomerase
MRTIEWRDDHAVLRGETRLPHEIVYVEVRAEREGLPPSFVAAEAERLERLTTTSPMRVHTHCNAGALACVEWGTALGIVRVLHERGSLRSVTADKIGTYPLALAAARAGVPFVVAAPESTLDPATPSGEQIEIEIRDEQEVLDVGDVAFDVTPADLVTAIVTERRVIRPAAGERP